MDEKKRKNEKIKASSKEERIIRKRREFVLSCEELRSLFWERTLIFLRWRIFAIVEILSHTKILYIFEFIRHRFWVYWSFCSNRDCCRDHLNALRIKPMMTTRKLFFFSISADSLRVLHSNFKVLFSWWNFHFAFFHFYIDLESWDLSVLVDFFFIPRSSSFCCRFFSLYKERKNKEKKKEKRKIITWNTTFDEFKLNYLVYMKDVFLFWKSKNVMKYITNSKMHFKNAEFHISLIKLILKSILLLCCFMKIYKFFNPISISFYSFFQWVRILVYMMKMCGVVWRCFVVCYW